MCGFAGAAAVSKPWLSDASALVARMCGVLEHRGPDSSGQWVDDHVVFGHQRLSILDITEAGAQPMFSASGRSVIVFNGEIYNFQDLAKRLSATGWVSRSFSDTEVLIECIEQWGLETTLAQVDGMFAFALYNRQRHELVLCRDRFGEKPLYYGVQNGTLYFASELKAFDVLGGPELLLDKKATAAYFRYGFVPAPLSIYHGFYKVRPASVIRVDLARASAAERLEIPSAPYWTVPEFAASQTTSLEEIHQLLLRSVGRRLVSDRPIGAFLSGGVDSSLTCALAAESVSGSLRTFNMGWDNEEHDESEQAQQVARSIGAIHHRVEMSVTEASSVVDEVGHILDEPNADGSLIGMYLVAREARGNFVVALSGDGGDEVFGGYNRHVWLTKSARFRREAPAWSRRALSRVLQNQARVIGVITTPIPTSRRPRLIANKISKMTRVLTATSGWDAYESVVAINSSIRGYLAMPPSVVAAIDSKSPDTNLWGLRAADLSIYLSDSILAKVDRASMAVSLETRTAFLEPDLVLAGLGMSHSDLIDRHGGKAPLRRIAESILPSCNFHLPKTGFGTPFADIMRGPARQRVAEAVELVLQRPLPRDVAIVDWKNLWRRFQAGDDSHALEIWSLLVFELWAASKKHEIVWA